MPDNPPLHKHFLFQGIGTLLLVLLLLVLLLLFCCTQQHLATASAASKACRLPLRASRTAAAAAAVAATCSERVWISVECRWAAARQAILITLQLGQVIHLTGVI